MLYMLAHEHDVVQNIVFVVPVISKLSLLSRKSNGNFSRVAVFCFVLYKSNVRRVARPIFVTVAPISVMCPPCCYSAVQWDWGWGYLQCQDCEKFFNLYSYDFTSPVNIVARYYCRYSRWTPTCTVNTVWPVSLGRGKCTVLTYLLQNVLNMFQRWWSRQRTDVRRTMSIVCSLISLQTVTVPHRWCSKLLAQHIGVWFRTSWTPTCVLIPAVFIFPFIPMNSRN
jgi:hypothetical protein